MFMAHVAVKFHNKLDFMLIKETIELRQRPPNVMSYIMLFIHLLATTLVRVVCHDSKCFILFTIFSTHPASFSWFWYYHHQLIMLALAHCCIISFNRNVAMHFALYNSFQACHHRKAVLHIIVKESGFMVLFTHLINVLYRHACILYFFKGIFKLLGCHTCLNKSLKRFLRPNIS